MAAGSRSPGGVPFAGGVLDRYRHVCAFVNVEPSEFLRERGP
jgi:hypothetical protein